MGSRSEGERLGARTHLAHGFCDGVDHASHQPYFTGGFVQCHHYVVYGLLHELCGLCDRVVGVLCLGRGKQNGEMSPLKQKKRLLSLLNTSLLVSIILKSRIQKYIPIMEHSNVFYIFLFLYYVCTFVSRIKIRKTKIFFFTIKRKNITNIK